MAMTPAQLGRDPQFEAFLYAPVGEDGRGASVTVLSMLARLGVDPWGEASDLTALPDGAARQRLEALMARFSDVQTLVADRGRIVAGLLAFLPKRESPARLAASGASIGAAFLPQVTRQQWIIAAALLISLVALLAQSH